MANALYARLAPMDFSREILSVERRMERPATL